MDEPVKGEEFRELYHMGVFTAIAIAIHNFTERFATFARGMKDIKLGIPIAIAIALHNIPEGVAVSVPIYYSTNRQIFIKSLDLNGETYGLLECKWEIPDNSFLCGILRTYGIDFFPVLKKIDLLSLPKPTFFAVIN